MGRLFRQGDDSPEASASNPAPDAPAAPATPTGPETAPLLNVEGTREVLRDGAELAKKAGGRVVDALTAGARGAAEAAQVVKERGVAAAEASAARLRANSERRERERTQASASAPSTPRGSLPLGAIAGAVFALAVFVVGGWWWSHRTPPDTATPAETTGTAPVKPPATTGSTAPTAPVAEAQKPNPPAATPSEASNGAAPVPIKPAPETAGSAAAAPVAAAPSVAGVEPVTYLPAPTSVSAGTCGLIGPIASKVAALNRAALPGEKEWLQVAYRCIEKGFLTSDAAGAFAVPAKSAKPDPVAAAPAMKEKPTRPETTSTGGGGAPSSKAKPEKPDGGSAPSGKSKGAATGDAASYAITPDACAAHIGDFNALRTKTGNLSKADRDRQAQAQACMGLRYIGSSSAGYVATAGAVPATVPGMTGANQGGSCVLRGAVVSQDGNGPLAGATVTITGLGIAASGTTTTDANGGWTFSGLPQGSVSVRIEAKGHFPQKAQLQTCGGAVAMPVTLETCNFLTCKARQMDEKLGLRKH